MDFRLNISPNHFLEILFQMCILWRSLRTGESFSTSQRAWLGLALWYADMLICFADMSDNAVLSGIFTPNTFSEMTEDLKHLFLIQWNNKSPFLSCNQQIVRNRNV